jgi:hypothetical protein
VVHQGALRHVDLPALQDLGDRDHDRELLGIPLEVVRHRQDCPVAVRTRTTWDAWLKSLLSALAT